MPYSTQAPLCFLKKSTIWFTSGAFDTSICPVQTKNHVGCSWGRGPLVPMKCKSSSTAGAATITDVNAMAAAQQEGCVR